MSPKIAYEVAISSVGYDTLAACQLEDGLRDRLGKRALPEVVRSEVGASPQARVLESGARVVVVLHQHLWGETPSTHEDRGAIRRRVQASGAAFLHVLQLDDARLPTWMRGAAVSSLIGADVETAVERIVATVIARGGTAHPHERLDAPERTAAEEKASRDRATFLSSMRATSALGHEFNRLIAAISDFVSKLDTVADGPTAEVHSTPHRCTVQMGPVALSLSWIRSRFDTVADGRLMVIEWEGKIGDRARAPGVAPARPLREYVLRADASGPDAWRWRSDTTALRAYSTRDLAGLCVDSMAHALQANGR